MTLVASRLKLTAVPIEVSVVAANAAMVTRLGIPTPLPSRASQRPRMNSTGFGPDDRPQEQDFFRGHIVALVNDAYVVDLTVGQFRQPADGITTPAVWAARAPQLQDEGGVAVATFNEWGPATMLVYRRRRLYGGLAKYGAWNTGDVHAACAKVTARVRDRLKHGAEPEATFLALLKPAAIGADALEWKRDASQLLLARADRLADIDTRAIA